MTSIEDLERRLDINHKTLEELSRLYPMEKPTSFIPYMLNCFMDIATIEFQIIQLSNIDNIEKIDKIKFITDKINRITEMANEYIIFITESI